MCVNGEWGLMLNGHGNNAVSSQLTGHCGNNHKYIFYFYSSYLHNIKERKKTNYTWLLVRQKKEKIFITDEKHKFLNDAKFQRLINVWIFYIFHFVRSSLEDKNYLTFCDWMTCKTHSWPLGGQRVSKSNWPFPGVNLTFSNIATSVRKPWLLILV